MDDTTTIIGGIIALILFIVLATLAYRKRNPSTLFGSWRSLHYWFWLLPPVGPIVNIIELAR
jgi:hypothetical protein